MIIFFGAYEGFKRLAHQYRMGNYGDAIGHLFRASELGAHATMKEFL